MKHLFIVLVFLLFLIIHAFGQTPEENLKKYWTYRDRLKKYFIALSNSDEPGTNIPVMSMWGGEPNLDWGDGNGGLLYYIALLATEYRLLQLSGEDYSETQNELYNALKAVQRLDFSAEKYYRYYYTFIGHHLRDDKNSYSDDYNGFFIRDDADGENSPPPSESTFPNPRYNYDVRNFNSNWNNSNVWSQFNNHSRSHEPHKDPDDNNYPGENSQDNVWNYLLSFALVKTLVDDPQIKYLAEDLGNQMVKFMHYRGIVYRYIHIPFTHRYIKFMDWEIDWKIVNPVWKIPVDEGSEVGYYSLSGLDWGFASAGNWVKPSSFPSLHYFNSSWGAHKNLFFRMLDQSAYTAFQNRSLHNNWPYMCLATIIGFDRWDFASPIIQLGGVNQSFTFSDGYDWLHKFCDPDKDKNYIQLPLIYALLHGKTSTFIDNFNSDFLKYESKLNSAPQCGTYNFMEDSTYGLPPRPYDWSTDNVLQWPENKSHVVPGGFFNGLDYMLLHNLFWLNYIVNSFQGFENCNNWVFPHNSYGSIAYPASISCLDYIKSSCVINPGGDVRYFAGNYIELLNGFNAKQGSSFSAKVRDYITINNKIYPLFKKTNNLFECDNPVTLLHPPSAKNKTNNKQKSNPIDTIENKKFSISDMKRQYFYNENFSVFPNPTIDKVFIFNKSGVEYSCSITDIFGNTLNKLENVKLTIFEVDLLNYSRGVYLAKIFSNGNFLSFKIIKQ